MRHTNATHRRLAGAASESTQQELGHTDIKTTMLYTQILDKERQDDAEKLARFANEKQPDPGTEEA
jgi:site-specific recombinase XerD